MPYSATYRSQLRSDITRARRLGPDATDSEVEWGMATLYGGIAGRDFRLPEDMRADPRGSLAKLQEVYDTGSLEAMQTDSLKQVNELLKNKDWRALADMGKKSDTIFDEGFDANLLDENDRSEWQRLNEKEVKWKQERASAAYVGAQVSDGLSTEERRRLGELVEEAKTRTAAMRQVERVRRENAAVMLLSISPELTDRSHAIIERAIANNFRITAEDQDAFLPEEMGGLDSGQKELLAAYMNYVRPTEGKGAWAKFTGRMLDQTGQVLGSTADDIADLWKFATDSSYRNGGYDAEIERRAWLVQANAKKFADLGVWGNTFAEAGGVIGYWAPMLFETVATAGIGDIGAAAGAARLAAKAGAAGRFAGRLATLPVRKLSHVMFMTDFRQQFLQRIALDGGDPASAESQIAASVGALASDLVEHIQWGKAFGKTAMPEVVSQAYSKLTHGIFAKLGIKVGKEFGQMTLGKAAALVVGERLVSIPTEAIEEAIQQAIEEVVVDIGDGRGIRGIRLANLMDQSAEAFVKTIGPMAWVSLSGFPMRARSAYTMHNLDKGAIDRLLTAGERLKRAAATGQLELKGEDMGVLGRLMHMTARAVTPAEAYWSLRERGFTKDQAETMLNTFAAIRRAAIEEGRTTELGSAILQADEELEQGGFELKRNADGSSSWTRVQTDEKGQKRRQTLRIVWGPYQELDMDSPAQVGSALDYIRKNESDQGKAALKLLGLDVSQSNVDIMADKNAMIALRTYVAKNEMGDVADTLPTGTRKSTEADGSEIDEDTFTITLTEKATRESIWHEVGHAAGYALRRMGLSEEEIDAIQNWRSGEDGKALSEADMALPEHAGAGETELYGEERVNYELAGEIARKNEPKTAFARGLEYVGDLVRNVLRIRKKAEEDGNAAAIMTELIWHGHLGKLDTLNDAQKRVLLEARRRRMATDAARETPPPAEGPSSAAEGPSSEAEGTKPAKTIRPPDERTVANFCFDRPILRDDMARLAASGEVTEDDIYETGYRWSPFLRAWVVQPELKGQKFTPNGRYMGLDGEWKGEDARAMVGTFADGTHFVEVDDVPDEIRNETDPEKLRTSVRNLIREKWMNRIIDPNGVRVFVNGATAQEYVQPAKELDDNAFRAKMDAAGKLDEVVSTSTNPQNAPDGRDGHVHKNVKEWEYRDAIFHVNGRYYGTLVNIAVIETVGGRKGNFRKLHDITQIKDITDEVRNLHGDPVGELQSYPSTVGDNANEPPNAPGVNSENQGRSEVGSRRMYAAAQNLPSPEFAMDGTIVDALPAHLREDARAVVAERSGTAAWMVEADGTPTELGEKEWLRREAERRHGERRYAFGGIYSGGTGDYANKSRVGGVGDGPSLRYVGTGDGSAAFGYGLYGSTGRNVAESYAEKGVESKLIGSVGKFELLHNGEPLHWTEKQSIKYNAHMGSNGDEKSIALYYLSKTGSVKKAIAAIVREDKEAEKSGFALHRWEGGGRHRYADAIRWLNEHGKEYKCRKVKGFVYERTFFTNRATPAETERHLLHWYEELPNEQFEWIKEALKSTNIDLEISYGGGIKHFKFVRGDEVFRSESNHRDYSVSIFGANVYGAATCAAMYKALEVVLGTQKAASELLVKAGLDGIKYPIGSIHGKTQEGFNLVSFRDDNIRVDHKWVDGEQRYQIAGALGAGRLENRRLADAEEMERSGATREEIWRETGWWRGADGKWRVEIPDFTLSMETLDREAYGNDPDYFVRKRKLPDLIGDTRLFDAYPQLRRVTVQTPHSDQFGGLNTYGDFNNEKRIRLNMSAMQFNPDEVRATLAHEIQHAIQAQEGLAQGGNAGQFKPVDVAKMRRKAKAERKRGNVAEADRLETEADELEENALDGMVVVDNQGYMDEFEAYQSLAGEVEARNVEKRLKMTPEERTATPPWETEKVEEGRQIVRFQIGGKAEDGKTTAQGPLSESDQTPPVQFSGGATSIPLTRESADPVMKFAETIVMDGAKSPEDFLVGIFGALGSQETNPNKTQYFDITQPDGRTLSLRTANHRATAHQYTEHGNTADEKLSVVVKMSEKPFKSDKDVQLTEFVYFPDKLTAETEAGIAKGLAEWIRTGKYTGPNADQVNVSPKQRAGQARQQVGGRIREYDHEPVYSPRGQLAALATMYLIQGKEPDRGNLQQIKERLGEQGDVDQIIAEAKEKHGRILEDLKAKGRRASAGEIVREAARRTMAAHPEDLLEEAYKRGAKSGVLAQRAHGAVLSALVEEARGDNYYDFVLEDGLDCAWTFHRFVLHKAQQEKAASAAGNGADAEGTGAGLSLENAVGFSPDAQGPIDPNSEVGRKVAESDRTTAENIERVLRELEEDWEERNRRREERRLRRLEKEREEEENAEKAGNGTGEAGGEVEDTPDGMDENDIAVEVLERNHVDIRDPWKFALFLRKDTRNRILKRNGMKVDFATLEEALAAEEKLWANPVNVAEFAKSMAALLKGLAEKLMDHAGETYPAVLVKLEQLSRMQNVRAIEIQAAFEIATIARRSIRETTGKMVEQTRSRLQKSYIGKHRFGEHDELEEDLKRKITGHVRRMAIWYKRVLGLTEGGIEREREKLLDRLSERNRALDEAAAQGVSAAKADEDAVAAETLWKLKALDAYGGTRYLLPGEARERLVEMERWMATESLKQAAKIEMTSRQYKKDRETIIKGCAVRDPSTGEERTHEEDSKLDRFWRMTVNTINQRFRLLFARASGQEGAAARELAERDSLRISQGTTRYEREKQEMRRALRDTVREVVGPRGVRAWVKHLQEEIPEEHSRALSKQGYRHLTYGQVMHLYGYLRQTATYGDNISRHGRVGQRVYIERNVLTAEDIKILNGMMRIYAERREALDAASRDITGFEMKSPDPWYMPVKIKTPTRSGLETVVSTVDAMPAVFSERRKHQLDVDEKADIMVMFNDRMEQSARVLGLGRTGLDVIHTWGSADVKDAITKARGKKFTTALVNHLTDWMNGGRPRLQNRAGEDERFLNGLRTVGTYTALWGNVLSGLKQTLSSPVFALAREVGERSIFQDMREFRSDAWKQAWRELAESDPYKARYGDVGVMEETKEAVQGGNMTGRLEAVLRAGMKPIELGDKTPGIIVGVGMYMAARDRMVDSGMDPDEAKRKAADLTMQAVEWTQQSGRTENQPEYARRGSSTTRLLMMFASSPMLQAGWEVQRIVEYREKREAFGKDSKEARDAATALRNAIIINHVVMPLAFQIASWGFQALLGRPPEEEDLPELLYACAIGPYSRLLVLSGLAHAAWNAAMGRSTYGRWNTVPSALVNLEQDVIDAVRLPIDLATWKPEEAWKDIDRFLRRNIAIYRHGRTAWHNWAEAE